MKKILISTLLMLFTTFSISSADVGLKIGVSGMAGLFEADGTENENGEINKTKDANEQMVGLGSIFVEKDLTFLPGFLSRLSIGYNHVPYDITTGTKQKTQFDKTTGATEASSEVDQNFKAKLSNLDTVYMNLDLTDWLYVKAGVTSMDIQTIETLETGSVYGNMETDGLVFGIGIEQTMDNGIFFRAEGTQTSYDSASVTSSTNTDNKITLDSVDGVSAVFSIGKTF